MAWTPLLHFSFENRAALDETGNGFHGRVVLPGPDRWLDRPAPRIATAVRFDHPEARIVVPATPAFAGWRGLRVRCYFRTENLAKRLNLVEGDGAFALFTEPGGVLCGTINDGSATWWGVVSPAQTVKAGRWHLAELIYDSGHVIALSLDGRLIGIRMSSGLPIRPVAAAGIQIGYWPGGDARYTFQGLIGPVWIDRLDEREPAVGIVNKLICGGSDGTSRLERMNRILRQELSPAEQDAVRAFGRELTGSLKRLMAVVVGQAAVPASALDTITALADELGRLVTAHELASSDVLFDPALRVLLTKIYSAACSGNPAAAPAFFTEALRLIAAFPLPTERWRDIVRRHPELCVTPFPAIDLSGRPRGEGEFPTGWVDELIGRLCRDRQTPGRPPVVPGCVSGCGEAREADRPPVHVHVHCCDRGGEQRG